MLSHISNIVYLIKASKHVYLSKGKAVQYVHLLLLGGALLGVPYAAENLVAFIVFYLTMFYWLIFTLLSGLRASGLNVDGNSINNGFQHTVLTMASLTMIYMTPYSIVTYIAAPYVTLQFMTNFMALLVYFEIIEIRPSDDDE
jgi:hypothetical protein